MARVKMERQLIVDESKCTGCRMCEMACSLEKESECSRPHSRIKVVKLEGGVDMPLVCLQCEDPVCKNACPVRAMSRSSNGAIVIDYDLCIGCKMCVALCPFGAVSIDPKSKKVIKCDLCGGKPKCIRFCQTKALDFVRKDAVDLAKKRDVANRTYSSTKNVHKPSVGKVKI